MRESEAKSRPLARQMRKDMPKAEVVLWKSLRHLNTQGYKFRRQHPIGPYIADFVHIRGKLVIEVDGNSHGTDERIAHDRRRDAYMRSLGWRVARFSNGAVCEHGSGVVDEIVRLLTLT